MSSFTNTGLVHFCMVTFSPPEARPRFCVQGHGATPVIVAHFAGGCTAARLGRDFEYVDGGWQSPTRRLAVRSWGVLRFRPGGHQGRRTWAVRWSVRCPQPSRESPLTTPPCSDLPRRVRDGSRRYGHDSFHGVIPTTVREANRARGYASQLPRAGRLGRLVAGTNVLNHASGSDRPKQAGTETKGLGESED